MSDYNIAEKPQDERVRFYREKSMTLPKASDPRYIEMSEKNAKK